MSTAVAVKNGNGHLDPAIIESLVIGGDLSGMNNNQRVAYYKYRCDQVGLDPSAKPFDLLKLNGKLVLYANAGCTQQLCAIHKLSVAITSREKIDDIYCVTARVSGPDGRSSENMGSVPLAGAKGEALSNLLLKATTKAIRRTVLAHVGLGMLSEEEVETIPHAQPQGRGNPLRQEFAALHWELDACKSQEQVELLLSSPEFLEFESRDKQSSGMSFAGMLRDKAATMMKTLPERIRYEGNKIVAATNAEAEFANAGASSPDAPPAQSAVVPPRSDSAEPEASIYEGETVTPADRMEMDYMASVDSCDTVDEVKRVRRDIEGDKDNLGEQRYAALKKACVARVKEIEIGATLNA